MSLKQVLSALEEFLTSGADENIVLVGEWGTGKTEAWKRSLLKVRGRLGRERYAYVSVADCESLSALEEKIIGATVMGKIAGTVPTVKTVSEAVGSLFEIAGKHQSAIGGAFNLLSVGVKGLSRLGLQNAIICLDDIERAKNLEPDEILHFAADLRDNRGCKVALILNEEVFKKEKEARWKTALEKGMNRCVRLVPNAEEALDLAFQDSRGRPQHGLAREVLRYPIVSLDIKNIRLIRKICRVMLLWESVAVKVAASKKVELRDLAARLALDIAVLELANTEADETLSLEACRRERLYRLQVKKRFSSGDVMTPEEKNERDSLLEQTTRLKRFGFSDMGALEKAVLASVQNGYLPEKAEESVLEYVENI